MPKQLMAIIPAAGHSRRMRGNSKLLLPIGNRRLIDLVLEAWTESTVGRVVMVVRQRDKALQKACRRWQRVEVLVPEDDPPDMKHSIRFGIHFLAAVATPASTDRWLVAPADLPTLSAELIDQVGRASQESDQIVAPRFGDRAGHPVSLPWSLASELDRLQPDQGLDQIIRDHPVDWLEMPPQQRPSDIDTPADYQRHRTQE